MSTKTMECRLIINRELNLQMYHIDFYTLLAIYIGKSIR